MKPEKCRLLQRRVPFVGHILSVQEVSTDPEKVPAVKSWHPPTNVSELRVFLGKIGYSRKFIPDFATLASPLFQLDEKVRNFVWSNDCQRSFDTLKQALCEAPVLAFPRFDLPFILDTNASTTGVAAVLSQMQYLASDSTEIEKLFLTALCVNFCLKCCGQMNFIPKYDLDLTVTMLIC